MGKAGTQKLRMQIMRNDLRFCSRQGTQLCNGLFQIRNGRRIADVADMRRRHHKPTFIDRCVCVQLRPHTKDLPVSEIHRRPQRCKTTRQPDNIPVPHHRIIAPVHNLPVMREDILCNRSHPFGDVGCLRDHRRPRRVRARHHQQRVVQMSEQQMMQTRIR